MKPTAAHRIGNPATSEQWRHHGTKCHHSATDGVRADSWRDAAEHPDRHDAIGHRGRAAEGVRTAAGQADDGHLVDAERVRHGAQVIGERDDGVVLVRRRGPDSGPVDADQPDVVLLGVDPSLGRDLPSRTGGAVQPEDGASLRVAELGEPELTVVADRDVAFQPGTSNSDNHDRSVTRTPHDQSGVLRFSGQCVISTTHRGSRGRR